MSGLITNTSTLRYLISRWALSLCLALWLPMLIAPTGLAEGRFTQAPLSTGTRYWQWETQAVVAPKSFETLGEHSLQLDAQNHPHVAYGGDWLYYAWYDGGNWIREVVDDSPGVGSAASLAFDSQGSPAISYYDSVNHRLKYAHKVGGSWVIEFVAEKDHFQYVNAIFTSLSLDSQDRPHIGFYDRWFYLDVYYATWGVDGWSITRIDTSEESNSRDRRASLSLTLDSAGSPHLAYLFVGALSTSEIRYAGWDGTDWVILPVETGCQHGDTNPSMVLDQDDNPHIIFRSECDGHLNYASMDNGSWKIEVIEEIDSILRAALATDGSSLWVSYFGDYPNHGLYFAQRTDGNWPVQKIGDDFEPYLVNGDNYSTSVDVDTTGQPHFIYLHQADGKPYELIYISWKSGQWTAKVVDSGDDAGSYASLGLDSLGNPHIAYAANGTLNYARWTGSEWVTQEIASKVVHDIHLLMDYADNPHIIYQRDGFVEYAYQTGSSWTIVELGEWADHFSCALDNQGNPHIVYGKDYYDEFYVVSVDLFHATWTGSQWVKETVFEKRNLRIDNLSMAMDKNNNIHLAHGSTYYLMHTYQNNGTWSTEVVDDQFGLYLLDTDITVDVDGNPRIAYAISSISGEQSLMYARWRWVEWVIRNVDSVDKVGEYVSIALDSSGAPHFSYFDATNGDLKLASWNGYSYVIQRIDTAGDVGYFTSLAFDAEDMPHIAYYDRTMGDLKYAIGREADYLVHLPVANH
jgi:hypothetical protein